MAPEIHLEHSERFELGSAPYFALYQPAAPLNILLEKNYLALCVPIVLPGANHLVS